MNVHFAPNTIHLSYYHAWISNWTRLIDVQ